jgi:hypothetical protein
MTEPDLERVARILRLLPPAPHAWAQAARELPAARRELDSIVARAEADAAFRAAVLADLEGALEVEGIAPSPSVVRALRLRLDR